MDLSDILVHHYLPYAKTTISDRAIPKLDGLKPVQRRILYTMDELGLQKGDKTKSQNIVGSTMKYHPNGDSSIYDAMVLMTTGHDGLNCPLIESKGNFGKAFSSGIQTAAARYTEAKLAPICSEMFDGINENAVDMVPNYDNSRLEPAMLPVKFPSILVNNTNGIAVGMSSYIPTFSLTGACNATIGRLKGTIKNEEELADVIGAPEFTTGGAIHCSKKSLVKLLKTGKGTFLISGTVELYNNRIVIREVPYTTTVEQIVDRVNELVKLKQLQGVREAIDETGMDGLQATIFLKSGADPKSTLRTILAVTPLRSSISFRTRVIINNRCETLSVMGLIDEWIKFRENCITRVFKYRLENETKQAHLLSLWDKIKNCIPAVAEMIAKNTTAKAKELLISQYKLDEEQADYVLDLKIKSLTTDRARQALEKVAELREQIKYSQSIINDQQARYRLIVDELTKIVNTYGTESKTKMIGEIDAEAEKNIKPKISEDTVHLIMTKQGYLRRITSLRGMSEKFVAANGDEEVKRWVVKNNGYLIVYDRFGTAHKILVDSIDASNKNVMTDNVLTLAGLEKASDVVWIDATDTFHGFFHIIYPNGTGERVYYDAIKGNRKVYKSQFREVEPGRYILTQEVKFFIVTKRKKASYVDLTMLGMFSNRKAFKAARINGANDCFVRIVPLRDVPNINLIDLDKYTKPYCVSIGQDILYWEPGELEAMQEQRRQLLAGEIDVNGNPIKKEDAEDTGDKGAENTEGTDLNTGDNTENQGQITEW